MPRGTPEKASQTPEHSSYGASRVRLPITPCAHHLAPLLNPVCLARRLILTMPQLFPTDTCLSIHRFPSLVIFDDNTAASTEECCQDSYQVVGRYAGRRRRGPLGRAELFIQHTVSLSLSNAYALPWNEGAPNTRSKTQFIYASD